MEEDRKNCSPQADPAAEKERLDFTFSQIASCPLSADIKERLLRCTVQKIAELAKFQDEILELGGHERDVTVYLETLLTSEEANTSDFAKRKIRAFQRDFDGRLQTVKEQVLLLRSLVDGMRSKIKQGAWPEQKKDIAVASLKRHIKMLNRCKTTPSSAKLQLDLGLSKTLSIHIKELQKFNAEVDALHRMMNKIRAESAKLEELHQIDPEELEIAWEAMLHRLEIDPLSEVITSAREVLNDVEDKANKAIAKTKEEKQRVEMENRRLKALIDGGASGKNSTRSLKRGIDKEVSNSHTPARRASRPSSGRRSLPNGASRGINTPESKSVRKAVTSSMKKKPGISSAGLPPTRSATTALKEDAAASERHSSRTRRSSYMPPTRRYTIGGESAGLPLEGQPPGQSSGLAKVAESARKTARRPSVPTKPKPLAFGSRLDSRRSDPTEWLQDKISVECSTEKLDPIDIPTSAKAGPLGRAA